jgi:hypothetical protein
MYMNIHIPAVVGIEAAAFPSLAVPFVAVPYPVGGIAVAVVVGASRSYLGEYGLKGMG